MELRELRSEVLKGVDEPEEVGGQTLSDAAAALFCAFNYSAS